MQALPITTLIALAAVTSASPLRTVNPAQLTNRDLLSGSITYYQVGLGACGEDDTGKDNSQNIVAMSPEMIGGDNSNCNRKIHIHGKQGQVVSATVRDKCPSCSPGDVDVSEKAFKEVVGDLGVGRAEVSWSWAN